MPPASTLRSRWPRFRSRASRAWLGAALFVAVVVALLDHAVWMRPFIQHHIQEKSGRRIDFDALRIGLNAALEPTFHFRNLVVENAAWATANRPLVRAAEFGFTLAWQSLRSDRILVARLDLVDAELDLERRADGLRNWRITRPDDRGPGRIRVQAIEVRNTRAHVVDDAHRLEYALDAAVMDAPVVLPAQPTLPLVRRIALRGTRDGTPFEAQFAVSLLPTFFDTGRAFALRGALQSGAAQAQVEGTLADLMQLARADVGLEIAGPRLAELGAIVGLASLARRVPALPTEARAHLVKDGDHWAITGLQARIGRSDLAGSIDLTPPAAGAGRSMVKARLSSQRIDLAGWRTPPPAGAAPMTAPALDADLEFTAARIDGALPLALTGLVARATLREQRAVIEASQLQLAQGRASGSVAIDTSQAAPALALDLRLQGLQLGALARAFARKPPAAEGAAPEPAGGATGALNARLALRAQGDSTATLVKALAGSVNAELVRASIPERLDAKLGLDGGHWLRTALGAGTARVAVLCSALDMRFERGRGQLRRFAFETASVSLGGSGWVDLGRESLDLMLTPQRKRAALLALDGAIHVSGAIGGPTLALVARDAAGAAAAPCTAAAPQ